MLSNIELLQKARASKRNSKFATFKKQHFFQTLFKDTLIKRRKEFRPENVKSIFFNQKLFRILYSDNIWEIFLSNYCISFIVF